MNNMGGMRIRRKRPSANTLEVPTAMPYDLINIEFDLAKDAENQTKHGISLAFGVEVLSDVRRLDVLDVRYEHAEERFISYGDVEGRVWVCVFVRRGGVYRIISVRRGNEREQKRYRDTSR